jgi:hypothetical protein
MRSTKRLPSSLFVPKDVFLYMTACRMQHSPKLSFPENHQQGLLPGE